MPLETTHLLLLVGRFDLAVWFQHLVPGINSSTGRYDTYTIPSINQASSTHQGMGSVDLGTRDQLISAVAKFVSSKLTLSAASCMHVWRYPNRLDIFPEYDE